MYSEWLIMAPLLSFFINLLLLALGTYIAARIIRYVFKDVIDKYLGK